MLPAGYEKTSFRRFSVPFDVDRLRAEFAAIPRECWASSYWGSIHCSVGMLLLRGGSSGTQEDFYSEEVSDHPILEKLPYMQSIVGNAGPFGMAPYAFLFRMQPNGVTRVHKDTMDRWIDMYRIHVPIISNSSAYFIAGERSIHFEPGYAWAFDNQGEHGVVNGVEERVHLIFDVDFNERLARQVDASEILHGEVIPENNEKIHDKQFSKPSYYGDDKIRQGIVQLRMRGLNDEQIAAFMNQKRVPVKRYFDGCWSVEMIKEISG